MPRSRPYTVLSSALAILTMAAAGLTLMAAPANAAVVTVIDNFGNEAPPAGTRTLTPTGATVTTSGGTTTVQMPNGVGAQAELSYSFGSPIALNNGYANALVLDHTLTSSDTSSSAGVMWAAMATDAVGRTATAAASAAPLPGQSSTAMPLTLSGGSGFMGTADMSRIKSLRFTFSTVSSVAGHTQNLTLDRLYTRNDAAPQAVTFSTTQTSAKVDEESAVNATATSGEAVTYAVDPASSPTDACTLTGTAVSFKHVGTCTIRATQAGSAAWESASATHTFTVTSGNDTGVDYSPDLPTTIAVGDTFTPSGVGTPSGTPATFSATGANSECRMDGAVLRFDHVGTCRVDATVTDTPDWTGVTENSLITVTRGHQTWNGLPSSVTQTVGSEWTVPAITEAKTSAPATVALAPDQTTCRLTNGVVSFQGAGPCVLRITGSGSDDWLAPEGTDLTISVDLRPQTTQVTTGLTGITVRNVKTIVANGSGNRAPASVVVDTARTTNDACVVDGNEVRGVRVGRCVVIVTAQANAEYAAGNPVTLEANVRGYQPLRMTGTPGGPASHIVGTTYTLAPVGVQTGLPATFWLAPESTGCVLDGSTITYEHVGTCRLVLNVPGNAYWVDQPAFPVDYPILPGNQGTTVTAGLSDGPVGTETTVVARGSRTLLAARLAIGPNTTNQACRVNGDRVVFEHVGVCEVLAHGAGNADWNEGSVSVLTAEVSKAAQTIVYTSAPPTAPAYPSTTYSVSATGGSSGKPVVLDTTEATVCTVANGTVTFHRAGTCTVRATQAGNDVYTAAAPSLLPIAVTAIPAEVSVALSPTSTVHGQATTFTATVAPALGDAEGSVQFRIGGEVEGDPVPLIDGRARLSTARVPSVGDHQVSATYLPSDDAVHARGHRATGTWTVSPAATTTTVKVGADKIVALVDVVAPGRAALWGTVTFRVDGAVVGSAPVGATGAELDYRVPAGKTRAVSATYSGYEALLASSDSTARRDPSLTATVTSAAAQARGWHRGPVTVTFTCAPADADLLEACPAPVVLKANQAGQTVSRTISASDGGVATVVAGPFNIDQAKPKAKLVGVPKRVTGATPQVRCVASDKLSGIAQCKVTVKRTKKQVAWTAKATDKAGNTTVVRKKARIAATAPFTLSGVSSRNGVLQVKAGRTYTMVVVSKTRPQYVNSAVAPRQPQGHSTRFIRAGSVNGTPRWVRGVTFNAGMKRHPVWHIGAQTGSRLHTLKVHVR